MAQLISIKLSRFDACPWGFRLQGGKDFGAPLLIQKVNGGSPAEKAGLQAGDAVIRVNDVELFNLRHKEAQDNIVKAGNNFELTVQRGGSTWKPQVTPVGPAPVNYTPASNVQPVTKTSLSAKKQDVPHIGAGHNFAPKPYSGPQVNGIGDPTVKSIVNKQYNTPVGIYSEETIAETLSAQAEVLAGGVLGVNFKKNEKIYNAANSEVLKMVQEIDSEPKEPEPEPSVGDSVTTPSASGLRHVSAPETKPTPTTPHEDPLKVLPPGQNICADCERLIVHAVGGRATSPRPLTPLAQQLPAPSAPSSYLPTNVPLDTPKCSDCERGIVGVFVRIKDKNLHVECFKCATCGTSLKNVGYYNINNKLYCDIHAKLVARQNPPAPNLEPVTIPPGSRAPAGTISAALSKAPVSSESNFAPASAWNPAPTYAPAPAPVSPGNLSPQPGTLGPLPFHPVHQHKMPENNFVTEKNMKNIITALPSLHIDDSDSGEYLPEPIITTPSKAPRGGMTHVSAPRPVQAPSSLAGPKPFSTPSAPITSSSRPATACSKFVWPPTRSEEEASSPTATPLYIPPIPHHETSISLTQNGRPSPTLPLSSVKSTSVPAPVITPAAQNRAAACLSPLTSALTIAPERPYSPLSGSAPAPADIPLPSQSTTSVLTQQTAPFPQPFSVYLTKQQTPLRAVSSPTPLQQGHSQPPDELPPLQPALQHFPCEENAISIEDSQAEDLSAVQYAGLHKKFSLCSQEVFSINADKSAPKFETLSETLQTQTLASSLTPDTVKRPESPVPMEDSKTCSFQDLPLTIEEDISKEANHNSMPDEQAKAVAAESTTLEATNHVSELVPPAADRRLSVLSEIQSSVLPESVQSTKIANIETTNIETKEVSSASQSGYIDVTEQPVSSQQDSLQVSETKSSSQLTAGTQEAQSTITASDGSFCPLPISAVTSQSEVISECEQDINSQSHTIPSQAVSGFVPVSWEQEYSAMQFQQQTRHISSHQSSSLISETIRPLQIFADTPPTLSFPSQAQDQSTTSLSPLSSALTAVSDQSNCPLSTVTKAVAPVPMQSAPTGTQASYPAAVKCVASGSLPANVQAPHNHETACPSPLLSALTVAPGRPYSPLPSATKVMAQFPVQTAPVSTQAVRPVAPVPLPAGIEAPLARGAAYPSVAKVAPLLTRTQVVKPSSSIPAPLQTNIQAPLSSECTCPSPLTSALTIAPDRPYSPLSTSTRPPDCVTLQKTVKSTNAPVPASVKFSPSEQLLRDETQFPILSVPSHKFAETSKPEPVSINITPKQRPVSSGALPVIGAFRPIIPATEFQPITSEVVLDKEPHSPRPPVSYELSTECAVSPARPKTPVQRIATPTSCSRSGTPFQQQKYTTAGLQKPAIIPIYQQQMGEFPGQRPRSATPTCPMTVPRAQTPKPLFTKTEVPNAPQKPSASFQRQLPPHKPYASYQPAAPAAPPAAVQPEPLIQQSLMPFPNIPLPEVTETESLDIASRPITIAQPQPFSAPQHLLLGPSPLSTIQPLPLCPVPQLPTPAAPQPVPSALVVKPSPLSASQSKPAAPEPSISTTMPVVPKTVPVLATQPVSIASTPSAPSSSSVPNAGGGGIGVPGGVQKGASIAGSTAPHRGRGVMTQQSSIAGGRIPLCAHCSSQIRGPFITALGKNWCPDHFVCVNSQCRRPLADIGFVEEKGELYCEYCFEKYLAPTCDKCSTKVKGDCLNAIGKHFHPECFLCAYCGKLFGNNPFFLEDGLPYCEADWNELFTTKCFACGFPIEAGDRWVEALNNNYHSQCFNCTNCKRNLEGQSFYAKGGRPFCKAHAR